MNKKAQGGADWDEIIKFILIAPVLLVLIGGIIAAFATIGKQNCPTCDCSQYQNGLNDCTKLVENLSNQINQSPIQYIQNVTYVDRPIETVVYRDSPVKIGINIIAFILSFTVTFKLFKVRVKLSKQLQEKLDEYEDAILAVKVVSLILTILIALKLFWIFISL